jgi:hypothetical protein
MRQDSDYEDEMVLVLHPDNHPVLVPLDIENGIASHGIGVRIRLSYILDVLPIFGLRYLPPYGERINQISVLCFCRSQLLTADNTHLRLAFAICELDIVSSQSANLSKIFFVGEELVANLAAILPKPASKARKSLKPLTSLNWRSISELWFDF